MKTRRLMVLALLAFSVTSMFVATVMAKDAPRMKELGVIADHWKLSPQAEQWGNVPDENKEWEARCMEVYAAMIDRMDQGIGRIVAELKKQGILDNTLIFFLQDNGGCAEGMGRRGDRERADKPTLPPMDAAALQPSMIPRQTRDPVFKGKKLDRKGAIFWEHEGNRAVRLGKWKLVAKGRRGPWELYDMEADRSEMNNLAEEQPKRIKKMAEMWTEWAERANVLPWPGSRKPKKRPAKKPDAKKGKK